MTIRTALNSLQSVEIHLNLDTLEARHCLTTAPMRYHDGFNQADRDAGWQQILAVSAEGVTWADIEAMKAEAIARNRAYWLELRDTYKDDGIIANGNHHVAHKLGVGGSLSGSPFRVDWFEAGRPSLICYLSTQGAIPGWLRPSQPDNATITELDPDLKQERVT